jgi:hypothetical protein
MAAPVPSLLLDADGRGGQGGRWRGGRGGARGSHGGRDSDRQVLQFKVQE